MRWGVIGCGVIGRRRGEALPKGSTLVACYDLRPEAAQKLAKDLGGGAYSDLNSFFLEGKPDIVIVSTINSALLSMVQTCIDRGVPCLVEKPAARSFTELKKLKNPQGIPVKVGFNHRFHPAYLDLLDLLSKRPPEDALMYVRARYGNGARLGFDREWRASVELAGGGELLDQGVHLIDLALQICPGLEVSSSLCKTHYWDMPVDDNAWALLSAKSGESFSMQVSSTEWKNEFQFDVYTRSAKYTWQGLGRSYGPETLTVYRMKPEMGPPEVEVRRYDGPDESWLRENESFEESLQNKKTPWGNVQDALECLRRIRDIYEKSFELQGNPPAHPRWLKDPE